LPPSQPRKSDYKRRTEKKSILENPLVTKTTIFTEEKRNKIIDWITLYRRNIHIFVQHYFGIKLYPYQILWIYWMSMSDSFVAICSRAVGKTWVLAVFACARAVLYPNSEIVVVSSTKEQAGVIVSDKITNLRDNYPNLAREISNITTNLNKWQVDFWNGSVIKVVASRDSARGNYKFCPI
jgi:reverse gyrase